MSYPEKIERVPLAWKKSQMEDPLNTSIVPHSLTMRPSVCEYCSQPVKHDVLVEYLFGIKACGEHHSWATRDCRAYMHEHGMVRLSDAVKIVGLSEFLAMLKEKEYHIPVKRSSGAIDTDWSLIDDWYEYPMIMRVNGEWAVQLRNSIFRKYIPVTEFLNQHSLEAFPLLFADHTRSALSVLEAGVYKAHYDEQKRCSSHLHEVEEHPLVKSVVMPNGTLVRVFSP